MSLLDDRPRAHKPWLKVLAEDAKTFFRKPRDVCQEAAKYVVHFRRKFNVITQLQPGVASGGGGSPFVLPAARTTTWQPGVTYNTYNGISGIPTNRTQNGATIFPATPYNGIGTSGPTVTINIGTGVVTVSGTAITPSTNLAFLFETTGALPTGISTQTLYYMVNVSGSTFQVASSAGGGAIGLSGTQSGTQTIVLDDVQFIQPRLAACPSNQYIKLSTGVFRINSVLGLGLAATGINTVNNNITLRGSGSGNWTSNTGINGVGNGRVPGTFVADPTATQLVKWDRANEIIGGIINIGYPGETQYASHTPMTANAVKGTNTCTLSSNPGLSVGQVVIVEMVTDFINSPQNITFTQGAGNALVVNLANHGLSAGQSVYFGSSGNLPQTCAFTGQVADQTNLAAAGVFLHVTAIASGQLSPGMVISGTGVPSGTVLVQQISPSSGDTQTWLTDIDPNNPVHTSSESMTLTLGGMQYFVSPTNLLTNSFEICAVYFTSSTSITISGSGTKTFALNGVPQTGQQYNNVGLIPVTATASGGTITGAVSSSGYSYGQQTMDIVASSSTGSGTFNSWTIVSPVITVSGTGTGTVQLGINTDHPQVYWGNRHTQPGQIGSTRSFFHLQDGVFPYGARSFGQIVKIATVTGTAPCTVTIEGIFHYTFETDRLAQMSVWSNPTTYGIGIEDMFLFGGQTNNIFMDLASNCWVKNVDSMWCWAPCCEMRASYRCELRDSFCHEMPNSNPGGAGYITMMDYGTSDCLFENNIMWYGNKVNTMQSCGGGNVIAYNYMDDAADTAANPGAPEAGVNAAHNCSTYMTLIEGNYCFAGKGDSFWGGSPLNTWYMNFFSTIRAAAAPLNTYSDVNGSYGDFSGRVGLDLQDGSYNQNFVGNVISYSGNALLPGQTGFGYENISINIGPGSPGSLIVFGYSFGMYQDSLGNWLFDSTAINGQLRNGNWDWMTGTQIFYANIGDTGTTSTGPAQPFATSLYLPGGGVSPPAFWSGTTSMPAGGTWPWVNPTNGSTFSLPARSKFETITGLSPIPPGNQ